MLKIDFHVHTDSSHDSKASPRKVLDVAKKRGLSAIAITDHDCVEGGLRVEEARQEGDPAVVAGVEFTVPMGAHGLHIVGLFLTKMRRAKHYGDVIEQIRAQGGVVVLPHLYREGTGLLYHHAAGNISAIDVERLFAEANYVEGINYKCRPHETLSTLEFLSTHPKPMLAGSDAHSSAKVGLAWTEIESLAEFKNGHSSTRACMLLKNPGSKFADFIYTNQQLSLEDYGRLIIGTKREVSEQSNESEWKANLKKISKAFPLSLASLPGLYLYRAVKNAGSEAALTRRIDREVEKAIEVRLVALPGNITIESII